MADKVEIMVYPGYWEVRTKENITEGELTLRMRCIGKDGKGNVCHAVMCTVTSRKTGKVKGFRQKNDEMPHIFDCSCDERDEFRRITNLDYRAEGYSSDDIWKRIGKRGGGKKGRKRTGGTPPTVEPKETGKRKRDIDKPIKTNVELPRTIYQYLSVLKVLGINDRYAGSLVRDLIVDDRTVAYHRNNNLPEDFPVLIVAKKLHPNYCPVVRKSGEIILADACYNASKKKEPDNCLIFRIKVRGAAGEKMNKYLTNKRPDTFILAFGRLSRDPTYPNTYFVHDLDEYRIGLIRL